MDEALKNALDANLKGLEGALNGLQGFVSQIKETLTPDQKELLEQELQKGKFDDQLKKAKAEFNKFRNDIKN